MSDIIDDAGPDTDSDVAESPAESEAEAKERAYKESAGACKSDGLSPEACRAHGHDAGDMKNGGYSAGDCKSAGFGARDCKDAGYSAGDCRDGGYSARDCRDGGYSAGDCKDGGYSAGDCKDGGYSAVDCKDGGYSVGQMKDGGYSSREMYDAGFTADQMRGIASSGTPSLGSTSQTSTVGTTLGAAFASKFICPNPEQISGKKFFDQTQKTECVELVKQNCGLKNTRTTSWVLGDKAISTYKQGEVPKGTPICTKSKDGTYGNPTTNTGAKDRNWGHCGIYNGTDENGDVKMIDQYHDPKEGAQSSKESKLNKNNGKWRKNSDNYFPIVDITI